MEPSRRNGRVSKRALRRLMIGRNKTRGDKTSMTPIFKPNSRAKPAVAPALPRRRHQRRSTDPGEEGHSPALPQGGR
ncbi:hypothetical protein [Weizmannia acidilactici]|uniref:hypothetical protein n=1 Tax=Weizmannia acidilactici TaxID=2607726 RepID=UPI00124E9582|nr:hypothetical protein [Weizmannia acidilactici]